MELDGELMSKCAAWLEGGMVAFGDESPESGCLYSRSVEGSRDKTRCSTLCEKIQVLSQYKYMISKSRNQRFNISIKFSESVKWMRLFFCYLLVSI